MNPFITATCGEYDLSSKRIIQKVNMFSTRFDVDKTLWYGPDIPPLYNPSINLAQALLSSMSIFGSKIAQVSE